MYFKCKCDCEETGIFSTQELSFRTKCNKCSKKDQAEKYTINEIGNHYGDLTVIKKASVNKHCAYWVCKCSCGNEIIVRGTHLRNGSSKSCGCKGLSYNEYKITEMLSLSNIPFTIQKKFQMLGDLRFDFYVNNSYIIEYDGEQHFLPNHRGNLKEIHRHDLQKNLFCFSNQIPIIRIPFTASQKYSLSDLILNTTKFLLTPDNEQDYYKDFDFT